MTQTRTTIWEAARDRFAEWALSARYQDGSRSLPGSRRNTDHDIWSAPNRFGDTDKSRCGTASAVTARRGREDDSKTDRWQRVGDLQEVRSATPTSLTYVSSRGSPRAGTLVFDRSHAKSGKPKAARRAAKKGLKRRPTNLLLDNTHKSSATAAGNARSVATVACPVR